MDRSLRWDVTVGYGSASGRIREICNPSEGWDPLARSAACHRMAKRGYVYILTNRPDGTLYIGVTSDLVRRVWEHRTGAVAGFTRRYALKRLVYFEVFEDLQDARARERAMKAWRRAWKLRRIESSNPAWRDLYDGIARS